VDRGEHLGHRPERDVVDDVLRFTRESGHQVRGDSTEVGLEPEAARRRHNRVGQQQLGGPLAGRELPPCVRHGSSVISRRTASPPEASRSASMVEVIPPAMASWQTTGLPSTDSAQASASSITPPRLDDSYPCAGQSEW